LDELGVGDKPRLVVLNKIDRLVARDEAGAGATNGTGPAANGPAPTAEQLMAELGLPPDFVPVSAKQRIGLDRLRERIASELDRGMAHLRVLIPYSAGDLTALFHRMGIVQREEFTADGTLIEGRIPVRFRPQYEAYNR
jgi:GTP-binding protein HflX